jgi:hypothetical protein
VSDTGKAQYRRIKPASYLKIKFYKSTFMIAFGGVRNSTHFFTIFEPIVKLLIKLKNVPNYEVIPNAHAFFIFERQKFIAESAQYSRIVFLEKTFGDIAPPVY